MIAPIGGANITVEELDAALVLGRCPEGSPDMTLLANAGLPMLPLQGLWMLAALIPVISVEALLLRWRLQLGWTRIFLGTGAANLTSILAGVPLSWGAMGLIEIAVRGLGPPLSLQPDAPAVSIAYVVLNAAWMDPIPPPLEHLDAVVPMALAILMIPSYFFSVWLECGVCRRIWRQTERRRLWQALRIANGTTYGLLVLICMVMMLFSL